MRPYQQSLLVQLESFTPVQVAADHRMVILNQALDWDYMQIMAEECREEIVTSNRGLKLRSSAKPDTRFGVKAAT